MKPIKGLNTDVRPYNQPDGTYPYGRNGIQYDLLGSVTNEEGFAAMAAVVPYTLMGIIETDNKPILFSTNDTFSAIGYFNPTTGLYEPKFNDSALTYKLGFNRSNYITGEAQRNYKGEIVCAFTDKTTFAKYANLDNLVVTRLEDWNLFPFYKAPTINTSIDIGGRLFPGTYYASVRYERNDGTSTPYTTVSIGKSIAGINFDTLTDKALTITVTNTDSSYDFIVVAIIVRSRGITRTYELEPVPTNAAGSTVITYTGDNQVTEIDINEVLVPPARYSKVGTIGQLNDALYIADLTKEADVNDMQQFANLVNVEFVSKLINAVGAPPEHVSGEIKGFAHNEVYALYIRYRLTQGGVSKSFTIPGNALGGGQTAQSTEATAGGFTGKVFEVEDTIGTFNAGTFTGSTGRYQNSTETYPNTIDFDSSTLGGRNLRSQPVLHHKMPSQRWCKANFYSSEAEYGRTKLDILGLKFTNIIIPPKYANIINGYEILYAKRTVGNMTNYGQSIVLYGSVKENETGSATGSVDIYTTGSNWDSIVKTRTSTSYNADNNLHLRLNAFRFHGFDLLFNKPSIAPTFISPQFKLSRTNLRPNSLWQDGRGPDDANTSTVHLVDFTTNETTISTVGTGIMARGIVNGGQYLSQNININRFINNHHETTFGGQLLGATLPLTVENTGWWTHNARGGPTDSDVLSNTVQSYMIDLKVIKADVYLNFYAQTLVTAGQAKDLTDNTPFFGGDVYVCDYTFHTYGRHEATDGWAGYSEGVHLGKKVIHRIVCECVSNLHLRYEIAGNEYSKWYPHNTLSYFDAGSYPEFWDRSRNPNDVGYSKDFNAVNDLISSNIFSPFRDDLLRFPYRIHRGGKISRQTKLRSWRTFLALDYYECQKNMGLITKITGMEDVLYIHHENALFKTQDKAKLEAGLLSVTLGAGDIFQFEPQELEAAKLGYAGSQHELACVRIPNGYVFVDAKMGEIYIVQGGKLKNLSDGMFRLFKQYMRTAEKNVYNNGQGITIGWDQKYKRILLSVKGPNANNSFTLSYSILSESWVFFHDYLPNMYFHTREQLWCVNSNSVFKFNAGPYGRYIDGTVKPFYIDVVFKQDKDMILNTVNWVSEVITGSVANTDVENEFNTLTHITIWNGLQHTGRIALAQVFKDLQYNNDRRTEGEWSFNDFRDLIITRGVQFLDTILNGYALLPDTTTTSKSWYDKGLMHDKYFVVRFEFDNTSGKQLILHETNITATITDR